MWNTARSGNLGGIPCLNAMTCHRRVISSLTSSGATIIIHNLLTCSELNMDDMEIETRSAITLSEKFLAEMSEGGF